MIGKQQPGWRYTTLQDSPVLGSPSLLVVKRVPSLTSEAPPISALYLLLSFRPFSLAQNLPVHPLPIPFLCNPHARLHLRSSPYNVLWFSSTTPCLHSLCDSAAGVPLLAGLPRHPADRSIRHYRPCTTKQGTRPQEASVSITMLESEGT